MVCMRSSLLSGSSPGGAPRRGSPNLLVASLPPLGTFFLQLEVVVQEVPVDRDPQQRKRLQASTSWLTAGSQC